MQAFGTTFDLQRGTARRWYQGKDGIRRWADKHEPCLEEERGQLGGEQRPRKEGQK